MNLPEQTGPALCTLGTGESLLPAVLDPAHCAQGHSGGGEGPTHRGLMAVGPGAGYPTSLGLRGPTS